MTAMPSPDFSLLPHTLRPGRPDAGLHVTLALSAAAERFPDRLCLLDDGTPVTYEQAWTQVLRIATWLGQNGVSKGERVLLALDEHPEIPMIALAVAHVGAVVSVLPQDTSEAELRAIVSEYDPVCIFLDASTRRLKKAAEGVLTVWLGNVHVDGAWDAPFSELLATKPAWGLPFPGTSRDPVFLVFPDRGSSGMILTHDDVRHIMNGTSTRSSAQEFRLPFQTSPARRLAVAPTADAGDHELALQSF